MKIIHVASTNPVKVNAAAEGFKTAFPAEEFLVTGYRVEHGVPTQPMTDAETRQGSETRARLLCEEYPGADYWVGIEGGVEQDGDGLLVFAWVTVLSADRHGTGRTGAFHVPPEVARLVRGGMELGLADDQVFGRENSKQQNGAVGLLTHDLITRQSYYEHAVILALVPFINPQLFPAEKNTII
jgi:inosine/xanthosine triphosphatase